MKLKGRHIVLVVMFLIYFGLRSYFSLQTDYFNDDYSYFGLRQIENIVETGKPIIHDGLSYGGRTFVFMPLYFYILAFFMKLFPHIFIIKLVNNLFASTIIFAVYFLISRTLKNRNVALICSLVSASLPIYINETLNNISVYSVLVPGTFFLIFSFIMLEREKSYLNFLIPLTLLLIMVSSSTFLVLLGFLIYILLSYIENIETSKLRLEFIIFFMFFFMWANFIIYKMAFQEHGFSIIWNNMPSSIIGQYFTDINITEALANIGLFPFIFGIYVVYKYLFYKKSKTTLIFISFFLSTFIGFWLKLVSLQLSLIFLGSMLVILFGQFLTDFFTEIKKTKFSQHETKIYFLVLFLLVLTQIIPGLVLMDRSIKETPSKEYIMGFLWIEKNTDKDSTVLAIPREGHLVSYFSKRKTVTDTEYLLIEDAEVRLQDTKNIYTQNFKIETLKTLEKYNADYIFFSDNAKHRYNITKLSYVDDPCFDLVFINNITRIYKRDKELCSVKTI